MRPALFLALTVALLAGCSRPALDTPLPEGAAPRLLPLEDILPAPVSRTSDETAAALDARGAALRAGG